MLFVTLDLTDDITRNQSKMMATNLNIDEFYTDNEGKTGFMILFDKTTGEPLYRLTKKHSSTDIVKLINMFI